MTAPAFLTAAEAAAALGIPLGTFRQSYQHRFTDGRPPERRRRRVPRLFRRSEVGLVVERGWEALAQRRAADPARVKTP